MEDTKLTAKQPHLDVEIRHRELPDEDLEYLPVFLMARLFTYLGWLHTREATDTTEEMAPIIVEAAVAIANDLVAEAA